MGWGRDIFRLDYGYVEGGQHDAALESLTGDHILQYLYAEFDDGKDVLVITPHDLAYKGFGVDRGTVGTGNKKRRALEITRLDAAGSVWVSSGSVQNDITDPADITIDKPESARPETSGSVGSIFFRKLFFLRPLFFFSLPEKDVEITDPTDPGTQKAEKSGLDKPKTAGSVTPEKTDPQLTQTDPQPTQNGFKRVTRENLETLHQRDTATRQSSSLSIRSLQTCTSTGSIGTANLNR
jgi:hypothetical protein